MDKTVTDVMWEQEMLALNRRLGGVLDGFTEILRWADSTSEVLDSDRWPRLTWGTEWDCKLLTSMVMEWLPAVNRLIQKRTARGLSPEQALKFYAEDVMFMRPLSAAEISKIEGQFADVADADVMALILTRARNLFVLHAELAGALRHGSPWEALRREQEKAGKARFPKALPLDRALLNELVWWRATIHERVVNPFLEKVGPEIGNQEDLLTRIQEAIALAEGRPAS